MSIVWKPIQSSHAAAWAELSNLLAAAEGYDDEHYDPAELAAELEEPGVEYALDTLGAWDGPTMVAYGQLRVAAECRDGVATAFLTGGVHPAFRRRGLGRRVMDWLEPRAAELVCDRHPDAPIRLSLWAGTPGSGTSRLAEGRGFEPARYFLDLRVDLASWDGSAFRSRRPTGGSVPLDAGDPVLAEGVRRAHNESFAEHGASTERDPERWAAQLAAPTFRPLFSRVAYSPESTLPKEDAVDSYVVSGEYEPGELYVCLVGTRQRARRRGLASALLRDVLHAAKTAGYRTAALSVDAENLSGAARLYERVGFRRMRTDVVYEKMLTPFAKVPGYAGERGSRQQDAVVGH